MTNPYIAPTLTGYNANPPENDGSETPTNQVDWQKHIDKIGDPLKSYVLAMSAAITTALDDSFGNSFKAVPNGYTVVEADQGLILRSVATANGTVTLLSAATAGVNFPLGFVNNGTAIITLAAASGETINGAADLTLYPNDFVNLASNGSVWVAMGTFSTKGSFTPTFGGFSADPATPTGSYICRQNTVELSLSGSSGTSDSTLFTITNLPNAITPFQAFAIATPAMVDNNVFVPAYAVLSARIGSNDSTVQFHRAEGQAWTASGTKGFDSSATTLIRYPLRSTH